MAAELIDAGVDVGRALPPDLRGHPVRQARACSGARWRALARFDDGRLTVAVLTAEDFAQTGAEDSHAEGIVDHLRARRRHQGCGADSRGLRAAGGPAQRKVSLRATDDDVDVSAIARAFGGGGHRRAAGFTSELSTAELIDAIRAQV